MNKIETGGFKLQITNSGNNTSISGDIFFDGDKDYIVKLHNNGKEFTDEDSDKAILLSLIDFLQCEI